MIMKKNSSTTGKPDWAQIVQEHCPAYGGWVNELLFHPERKWRFDVACHAESIAIEIEGGVFVRGRHSRGKGMINDMEKYNAAVVLGWRLLRYTPDQMAHGVFIQDVRDLLQRRLPH